MSLSVIHAVPQPLNKLAHAQHVHKPIQARSDAAHSVLIKGIPLYYRYCHSSLTMPGCLINSPRTWAPLMRLSRYTQSVQSLDFVLSSCCCSHRTTAHSARSSWRHGAAMLKPRYSRLDNTTDCSCRKAFRAERSRATTIQNLKWQAYLRQNLLMFYLFLLACSYTLHHAPCHLNNVYLVM